MTDNRQKLSARLAEGLRAAFERKPAFCNIADGTHAGSITMVAEESVDNAYLVVKAGANDGGFAGCGRGGQAFRSVLRRGRKRRKARGDSARKRGKHNHVPRGDRHSRGSKRIHVGKRQGFGGGGGRLVQSGRRGVLGGFRRACGNRPAGLRRIGVEARRVRRARMDYGDNFGLPRIFGA